MINNLPAFYTGNKDFSTPGGDGPQMCKFMNEYVKSGLEVLRVLIENKEKEDVSYQESLEFSLGREKKRDRNHKARIRRSRVS
jgi:hypothetical protein